MKFIEFIAIAAAVAGLAACHHQPALRVVYVPAPPPAPSSAAGQGSVMVIQKPAPAPPAVIAPKPEQPAEHTEPAATQPAPPVVHKEAEVTSSAASPTATPPAGDAPQLEPMRSVQQQAALQQQIKSLQGGLRQRIANLSRRSLSAVDLKTLADAGTLLVQSSDAMKAGDFLQSLNLAKKADLLVAAVEKQQ